MVITIIVLLILVGVSISLAIGQNGILTQAKIATDKSRTAEIEEEIALVYFETLSNGLGKITKEDFEEALKKDFGNDKTIIVSDD